MLSLAQQLRQHGISLAALAVGAEAVIVFGSRAAGLARADSDWDLLIVGRGRTRLGRGLDLVYIEPTAFRGARWRTSELAGHVGRFGCTLAGDPNAVAGLRDVEIGAEAIERKRRQLRAQLGACERYWASLGSWAQAKRQLRLRRDLQRHARLLESDPIPPSTLLDREWAALGVDEQAQALREWLVRAELPAKGMDAPRLGQAQDQVSPRGHDALAPSRAASISASARATASAPKSTR